MHDGDRSNEPATLGGFGYLAAIVMCCIIVGGLTFGLGRENERRYETPASYAKAAKNDAQSACVGSEGGAAFECIYEKVEAAQEQARGEQDLSAQQKAANSALLSAIIAFFTLILTGVGIWFVKRTLDATLRAVVDTGKATAAMLRQNELAEAAQRPWISVDCEVSVYEREGPLATVKYTGFVTNQGKMAARNFCVTVQCKFFDIDNVDSEITHWFETTRRKRETCKHVLIPGERAPYEGESRQRIDMITPKMREVPEMYHVVILVSVQYQTFGGDEWHSTERSFCVGIRDDNIFYEQVMRGDLTDGSYIVGIKVRRFRSGLTT